LLQFSAVTQQRSRECGLGSPRNGHLGNWNFHHITLLSCCWILGRK
jgi:hypothetical protein